MHEPKPVADTTAVEWRLSVFAPGSDKEVAFLVLTEDQAKALGGKRDGTMHPVAAYIGAWRA